MPLEITSPPMDARVRCGAWITIHYEVQDDSGWVELYVNKALSQTNRGAPHTFPLYTTREPGIHYDLDLVEYMAGKPPLRAHLEITTR